MTENYPIRIAPNVIELHFWLSDQSHSMDAYVHNRCEYEFLGIARAVASSYGLEVKVETEPLAEGGLKRWFKIIAKSEKKTATITSAVVAALITAILVTPLSTTISKATEKLLDQIFENVEKENLEKEKLKLEIENLRLDSAIKVQVLDAAILVKKRRSNFFQTLKTYDKIEQVSIVIEDDNKNYASEEAFIKRRDFEKYILVSDELEPAVIDDVNIEIISPVLKEGNYKWRGIYNGMPIPFQMNSSEFKDLVKNQKIEFKNGSSINCQISIQKRVNNEGEEEVINYTILRVNKYFQNDKPIETNEGRVHRQKEEANRKQLKLFGHK